MIKAKMISNGYDAEGAIEVLLNTDKKINIVGIEEVFYPYRLFSYSVIVGKKGLSKLNKKCHCIVDGVSGSAYQGTGEPTFVDVTIDKDRALDYVMEYDESKRKSHDFVFKIFLKKAKLLATPDLVIDNEETFYKKFFIIKCLDDEGMEYFVMVDAVDGGLSILDQK